MLPHQQIERQVTSAATLDEAAASLALLLSSGLSVWQDGTLYYTKQLVARIHGLKIEVYAREHPPPHFHVTGSGINATFSLEDCSHISGELIKRRRFSRSQPTASLAHFFSKLFFAAPCRLFSLDGGFHRSPWRPSRTSSGSRARKAAAIASSLGIISHPSLRAWDTGGTA
jgi:hypothetical protein